MDTHPCETDLVANQHKHGARNIRGIPDELWDAYENVAGKGNRSAEVLLFIEFRTRHPEAWAALVRLAGDGRSPFDAVMDLLRGQP